MFYVELVGNGPRAVAICELTKDPFDDECLGLVDLGLAGLTQSGRWVDGNPVAKTKPACREAIFDSASLAPMDLL
ncbi:hypothetical protein C1J04_00105 [Sulfitobacter sp. SK025]|nr:hypothetical protein C1J04_00105 [Sulfitobacter sp. SK025]